MHVAAHGDRARMWRVLLLSAGVAFLWALITLFAQTSASSAAENDSAGKGLLGAVTSTVNKAAETVTTTVGEVGTTVKTVVKAVEPVTAPVVDVAPKPVRDTVKAVVTKTTAVVDKTVGTVDKTTAAVDTTVRTVVDETLTTVSDITAGTPIVGDLVGTPTALNPIIPTVGAIVPDLGPVLGGEPAEGTPGVDGPVTSTPSGPAIAGTVGAAVGPAVGAQDAFPWAASRAWSALVATTAAVVTASAQGVLPFSSGGFPVDVAPVSAPASGALVLTFGAMAMLAVVRPRFAASVFRTTGPQDDALPGAPVYETDTSPG